MGKRSRLYSPEFTEEAVRFYCSSGKSMAKRAEELGVAKRQV